MSQNINHNQNTYTISQMYNEINRYIDEDTFDQSWDYFIKNNSLFIDNDSFQVVIKWAYADGYNACNNYFKYNINRIFSSENSQSPTISQTDQLFHPLIKLILNAREIANEAWEQYAAQLNLNKHILEIYYDWIHLLYINAIAASAAKFEHKIYSLFNKTKFISHVDKRFVSKS